MSIRKAMEGISKIRLVENETQLQLIVRKGGTIRIVSLDEIYWIEADAHNSVLHFQNSTFSIRESLGTVEKILQSTTFVRLNRSALINVNAIREISPWMRGKTRVTMNDGTALVCNTGNKFLSAILSRHSNARKTNQPNRDDQSDES